jgi:septal ring factor EnvC (AmiA/AmiB activator)
MLLSARRGPGRPAVTRALLLLFVWGAAQAQIGIDAQRQELYQTRERLEAVERRLVELRSTRRHLENLLEKTDDDLDELRRVTNQIAAAQREKDATIARIRRAMYNVQEQIDQRRQDLAERLVAMYKYGRLFELELLLSSKSMPEVFRKLYYMRMIAEADRQRITELAQLQSDLAAQHRHFRYAAASLQELQREYESRQRQLRARQELSRRDLSRVQTETADREEQAGRLAAAVVQIEALVKRLEQEAQASGAAPAPSTLTGSLSWPVSGTVKAGYGEQTDATYGTSVRNNGIVIVCAAGSAVRAVARGRAAYAEEFLTYGNLVILEHGDGSYTLYGSLQDIAIGVGDPVEPGDVIGHAGSELYFELRRGGAPVDPLGSLKR